jgi:hypothetical protein
MAASGDVASYVLGGSVFGTACPPDSVDTRGSAPRPRCARAFTSAVTGVSKTATYEGLNTSRRRWPGDMSDITERG